MSESTAPTKTDGHPQHVELHNRVFDILADLALENKLWVFQIVGWDSYSRVADEIDIEARQIIGDIYAKSRPLVEQLLHARTEIVHARDVSRNVGVEAQGCHPPSSIFGQSVRFFSWLCRSLLRGYPGRSSVQGSGRCGVGITSTTSAPTNTTP